MPQICVAINRKFKKTLDVSPQKVMKVLMRLNPNKTPGVESVDQIYSVMLKNRANELAIPLSRHLQMQHGNTSSPWRLEDCQCCSNS